MDHLVEHMRISYHSVHEPTCGICKKHCRSFESLREHLIGTHAPLGHSQSKNVETYSAREDADSAYPSLTALTLSEFIKRGVNSLGVLGRLANLGIRDNLDGINSRGSRGTQVVAMACKMVGGGMDGTLDVCARVCLIDQNENIIFHTYVKPTIPVTNYRYETTGIRAEYLRDAMPVRQVQAKIHEFLCNGEPMWRIRPTRGGRAKILVGHGLDHDLDRLQIDYPALMIRDTAKYPPLMKTSKLSNSLNRMRSQNHRAEDYPLASDPQNRNNFASWRQSELERMSPEQMLALSRSDYYCWCLDSN
uniref:Exonuclease domain-containing protein n=1 Tax=Cannabis sativa TaxID=3483 RepID=A0A803QJA6_CANSA